MGAKAKPAPASDAELRRRIFASVSDYFKSAHGAAKFVPGQTPVPASGRVYDQDDLIALADAGLDFWLTAGRFAEQFEKELGRRVGLPHASLVNSGSSANLLAASALFDDSLGEKALKPGDEILGVAASFPTTVNPIIQNGAVPVFVDVSLGTYNVQAAALEGAISAKTKAIMIAHTLGNPFDLDPVVKLAQRRNLWLIEDCCDALGSTYRGRPVASFGDLSTFSFYPAHHITMGEGGAVATGSARLRKIVESLRDWGRDCWCDPGKDNTCGKRFDWQLGELPHGYDHKYIYSRLGYNMKATDMQAAIGVSQLKKLDGFIAARKKNFARLKEGLLAFEEHLILPEPTPHSDPAWFGFPLTVRDSNKFSRARLIAHLDGAKIGTRLLFAGDITRQPYFRGRNFRVEGGLANTDKIMRDSFWIGVYPGITDEMVDYVVDQFARFFKTL